MKAGRRVAYLFALTLLSLALLAGAALAQDETSEPAEPTPISQELEPAVTVPAPADDHAQLDWTYRYMIPTALALGTVIIVVTSAQYFTRVVRKRYRIVEE